MSAYAGIGSRETPDEILDIMEKVGVYLAKKGFILKTGNAKGADQAFARGANSVDPKKVELYLPWDTYEKEAIIPGNRVMIEVDPAFYEIAKKYHPAWYALKRGGRSMMARNIGIVTGTVQVICYLNQLKPGGGGTGQGVRYAKAMGIPVLDLSQPADLKKVLDKINV